MLKDVSKHKNLYMHLNFFIFFFYLCKSNLSLVFLSDLLDLSNLQFKDITSKADASELAKTEKLNDVNFHYYKHKIMLILTLERLIYVLEKFYPLLLEKPI